MPLGQEIDQYLLANMGSSAAATRNREIIRWYYGFGDLIWPSLEEVGDEFDDLTRERVRQIIKKWFLNSVVASDLPSLAQLTSEIESRNVHVINDLIPRLIDADLIEDDLGVVDLVRILTEIGEFGKYAVYDRDLRPVTRYSLTNVNQSWLISKDSLAGVKKLTRELHKLVGQVGIVSVPTAIKLTGDVSDEHSLLVTSLIKNTPGVWMSSGEVTHFTFDTWANPLTTNLGKSFTAAKSIQVEELSDAIENAFSARTRKIDYPSGKLIREYVQSSKNFNTTDGFARLSPNSTIRLGLNQIEHAVIKYLKQHGTSMSPAIRQHLSELGYGEAHIIKAVFDSPVIRVDKSDERRNYKYSVFGSILDPINTKSSNQTRYQKYHTRLKILIDDGSDVEVESLARKEQAVLREWVLNGLSELPCVICGHVFRAEALVAAHKKTRKECSKDERSDPHVVMPLCALGCDYIYESRYILISDGEVVINSLHELTGELQERVLQLVGRGLEKQWLEGPDEYFQIS